MFSVCSYTSFYTRPCVRHVWTAEEEKEKSLYISIGAPIPSLLPRVGTWILDERTWSLETRTSMLYTRTSAYKILSDPRWKNLDG